MARNGRGQIVINGRLIDPDAIPEEGVSGEEIIRQAGGNRPGRRKIRKTPGGFETVNPKKKYTPRDFRGRDGRPIHLSDIPDRTKG